MVKKGQQRVGASLGTSCLTAVTVLVVFLILGAVPVLGQTPGGEFPDVPPWEPPPFPSGGPCHSCLCERSDCEEEAWRRHSRCQSRARYVRDFFRCNVNRDAELFICFLEYISCNASPWK